MTLPARPRRSVLYMPGANARALDKARSLPADTLILDPVSYTHLTLPTNREV